MLRRFQSCVHRILIGGAATLGATCAFSTDASAHVKWFCAYNVAGRPTGLENVLCNDLELLLSAACLALMFGYLLETTFVGKAMSRALDLATEPLRTSTDTVIRAGCGFFLIALWTLGGIILTPELKTTLPWIPWLQLAIAIGLLWRQTMILSAAGLVFLFSLALKEYGLFHLMDYPVFMGLAGYLALTGMQKTAFGIRPLDLLRWTAAITLMWASIEKWAYPEWTYELFLTKPELTMGFDPAFFMRAAGAVEFALSFALLLTPLCRRLSALILMGMFVSAIGPFGKVDAIGHAPIIAALLAFVLDDAPAASWASFKGSLWDWAKLGLVPVGFMAAVAASMAAYYVLHSVLFGSPLS